MQIASPKLIWLLHRYDELVEAVPAAQMPAPKLIWLLHRYDEPVEAVPAAQMPAPEVIWLLHRYDEPVEAVPAAQMPAPKLIWLLHRYDEPVEAVPAMQTASPEKFPKRRNMGMSICEILQKFRISLYVWPIEREGKESNINKAIGKIFFMRASFFTVHGHE